MEPQSRRQVYSILMVTTLAAVSARVASAERVYEPSIHRPDPRSAAGVLAPLAAVDACSWVPLTAEAVRSVREIERAGPTRNWPVARPHPMPTFSSNDKSRWATIRALVEDGTFVIGRRVIEPDGRYRDFGRIFEPGYESVDKVLDPATNLFYSTKPPLLTVIGAGQYWILRKAGLSLEADRWLVVRLIVWSQNGLCLALILAGLIPVLEAIGTTDWGRVFTFACACFGTFLTTFSVTLNNHIPAAAAAFLAVQPLILHERLRWITLARCGLCAGLAACFELPAASLVAALGFYLFMLQPRTALLTYFPAAVAPFACQLALNHAAIGEFLPAYAKFGGADRVWYEYAGSHWSRPPGVIKRGIDWAADYESRSTYAFHLLLGHHGVFSLTPIWLLSAGPLLGSARRLRSGDRFQHVLFGCLMVSLVVIVFFAGVVGTANYGGWTSGPRWFFWLAPLWLLAVIPAADRLAGFAAGRGIGLACLAVSVFSACYPAANPWRHPWIYNWLDELGRIPYGK
jgi:hypothetical protein